MIRATKRATAFSSGSHSGPYPPWMRFSVRTYLTEVRRFCAILNRTEREKEQLNVLARELKPLLGDRRFVSLLTTQGFTAVPGALAEALEGQTGPDSRLRTVQYRSKLSIRAMMLLKDRELLTSVFGILEKMTPRHQIEAVRCMIAANCFTASHALRLQTLDGSLNGAGQLKRIKVLTADLRQIMVTQAEVLSNRVRTVASDYAERHLGLMNAKSYVRGVLANVATRDYLVSRHRHRMGKLTAAASR